MTDAVRHRLSLVLALIGTVLMLAHMSGMLWNVAISKNAAPAFEKSRPNIPDWPRHSWSPVG